MEHQSRYDPNASSDGSGQRRAHGRARVAISCELKIGTRAWHRAKLADLTPSGFQVATFDAPARGTPFYIRFAGLQMQHAEVCWGKDGMVGCRFLSELSSYVFEHIVGTVSAN